jgi:hypothetical protein
MGGGGAKFGGKMGKTGGMGKMGGMGKIGGGAPAAAEEERTIEGIPAPDEISRAFAELTVEQLTAAAPDCARFASVRTSGLGKGGHLGYNSDGMCSDLMVGDCCADFV